MKTPLNRNELDEALRTCRSAFGTVAFLSLFINVLMLASPIYMLQVMGRVLSSGSVDTLVFLTVMVAVAILVMCVLDTLRTSITIRIGCWLNERLGPVFLESGVRAQLRGDPVGAQSLRDIYQIQSFIGTQGLVAFFDSPWVPFFVAVIWLMHPWLGMVALASAIILLILSIANDRVTKRPSEAANMAHLDSLRLADTTIRNAEVVRSMGLLPAMVERWRVANGLSATAVRAAGESGGLILATTKFVRFFVQTLILGIGAWLVVKNELTAGAMIAASILLGRALAPVEMAIGAWKSFVQTRESYNRLKAHIETFPPEPVRTRLLAPEPHLIVQNLRFVAPHSGDAILKDVSFAVEPGEAVAVIGPSGAGKSTLCRLLVGLARSDGGEVRLSGSEVRHWNPGQLGSFVGYLPQDVELFTGTVSENIARMGDYEDGEVLQAAKDARVHDLIQRLPQGYDTPIGDAGVRLSGGQRQRVGLARAMFGDPRFVVLDEPNANLDQAGEAALAGAIASLKARGCSLVIVGHRPSTLAQADKILLVQDGRTAMFGPRDEVMRALTEIASAGDAGQSQNQKGPGSGGPGQAADGGADGGGQRKLKTGQDGAAGGERNGAQPGSSQQSSGGRS